jgi:hypothetical protein
VKNVLLQLDTDEHPSPFDAIVAYDAGVDVLLSHGGVEREDVRGLVQDAFFTRGIDDLKTMAVWVGGKRVSAGEAVFGKVQKAFFGPFRVSVMLDSNGCNTTAATTIARIAKDYDLQGKRSLVLGALAIGGPKMKVHKTCIRRMFESNDKVFDTDTVYEVAKELV